MAPSCFRTGGRGDGGLIGQTLSHYRVTAALGAGGMGEVYRATDANLHRDVAIKVLPPEVAQEPRRLERFRREAHLLAALNHPNIAAIYGLEEADGRPFLALELVEGEDLKVRLSRGAIPVDEALEIARQIAEALEEAHSKGIVHRDLKPANVKLTPDGKVKVLDFGLAKAWAGDSSGVSSGEAALSQSPTLAHTGTMAGVILGTAAYMSPEQARGKPVDKRADVWSFGVLLWEMLTGRALFTGETVTDVITAVMSHEPDLQALPASTPAAVRRLIARCLRRDPRQRLPDIGAARLDLQETLAGAAAGVGEPAAIASGVAMWENSSEVGWFGSAPGTLAYLSGPDRWSVSQLAWLSRKGERRGDVGAPAEYGQISLSPDATKAAVEIQDGDQSDLWVMDLERGMTTRVTRTPDSERDPTWSPDGKALAYCVRSASLRERGELRRKGLRVSDPEAVLAAAAERACPESWARDGTLVGTGPRSDVAHGAWARTSDGNGRVEPLPQGSLDELQVSPDGRWLAYVSAESGWHEVYVEPFRREGDRVRVSAAGGGQPKWRADAGELFFTAPGGQLLAASVRAAGDGLKIGTPTLLFEIGGLFPTPYLDDYAPDLDGQRFLVKVPVEKSQALQLHVVTGWRSLLER